MGGVGGFRMPIESSYSGGRRFGDQGMREDRTCHGCGKVGHSQAKGKR